MKTALKITVFAAAIVFAACSKDDPEKGQIPEVKTRDVSGITSYTAHITGEVTGEGDAAVTERGVCYSTSPDPEISDSKRKIGAGTGVFEGEITGLTEKSAYYLRAYATSAMGTAYGETVTFTTQPTISDQEGNKYSTVKIGNQTWMAESLKSTKFSNGEAIPHMDNWQVNTPAYCSYSNDLNISAVYGKLYNWYAANDSRNICPTGWHVPSDSEWLTLVTGLGGFEAAAPKMKETGTTHWVEDPGTNNSSGFSALGSGKREKDLSHDIMWWAFFWTKTPSEVNDRYGVVYIVDVTQGVLKANHDRTSGYSIRCLKD